MSLHKLAREIEETARQTAALVDGITEALDILSARDADADAARDRAVALIVRALQGQDRVEQRCRDLALTVRRFALLPPDAAASEFDAVWSTLALDELRIPALSGTAKTVSTGDAELF